MKQIPFVGLPAAEQDAVLAALRQAGVEASSICISRLELPSSAFGEGTAVTAVSGAGWCRAYPCAPGWLAAFTSDLQAWAQAAHPAQVAASSSSPHCDQGRCA